MTAVDRDVASSHNRTQREYFERASHRTLARRPSPYLRRHVDVMAEAAGIGPGDRVLEIGSGMGRYTVMLAERGIAVEALDLSAQLLGNIEAANTTGRPIPVHPYDVVDCPPELDGAFDAVVGFFVLHHVHELTACLEAAARLVRPGGRVAFIEPNPVSPLYYVQIALTPEMSWHGERGMLRMTAEHMFPAMAAAGLADLRFRRFGLFPPFVTNRRPGARLEAALEGTRLPSPTRPFHLFAAARPPGG